MTQTEIEEYIPVSRFTAFNQYQDSLYVKAENVTVAQKLVVPKVVRPVSSPKESPVTENCDEPVALVVKNKDEFSTEPIIKGKENKSTSKSKTDNKDVVDDESFFTKLKNKILPSKPKESEKPVAVKETPKPKETKQVPVKTELKNDKKKDAFKDIPVAEVKVKKSAKNEEKPTATIVKAPEKPTIKPLNTNTSTSKKINTPELIKEDDDNYKVVVYTVKQGDNLGFIANWFHVKVKEIRRWNELNGNFIDVDDELLIYVHNNDYKKFVRFNYISNRLKDLLSAKIETQEEADFIAFKEAQKDSTSIIDKINPIKILAKNKN